MTSDAIFISSLKLEKSSVEVFDAANGTCLKNYRGQCAAPNTLCLIGSADYIISAPKDKVTLQLWALNQNEALQMAFRIPGRVNVMAISQSEHKYCALGIEEKIFVYHFNSGCQLGMIGRHYQDVTCLKFSSCGNYFASASDDGFVYLWSLADLKDSLCKVNKPQIEPYYVLGQHSEGVTGLAFSGFNLRGILVSASKDHSAKVFDLATGKLRHTIIAHSSLFTCTVNTIGSQVFLGGKCGRVWGVNLIPQFYMEEKELEDQGFACHASPIQHMALNTACNLLITGAANGEVKTWCIVTVGKKASIGTPSFALQKLLFSGRGIITNIIVCNLDPEIFSRPSLDSRVVVNPFNSSASLLTAPVLHQSLAQESRSHVNSDELIKMASHLFMNTSPVVAHQSAAKVSQPQETFIPLESGSETFKVGTLKKTNEDLYKFCLQYLLTNETPIKTKKKKSEIPKERKLKKSKIRVS